jgi:outer membrane protein assembly factor BamB
VVALSAIDGALEWERDTSVDVEEEEGAGAPSIDVDTTPVVHGGSVFVGSIGGGVYALGQDGGGVSWRREDLRGVTGLANRGGTIYATVTGKGLVALDGATGQTLWKATLAGGALSQPVLSGGYAYVTSDRDGLYVVRLRDGLLVQAVEPGRGAAGAPVIVGRRVFFLSNSAVLYALEVGG